MNIDMDTAAIRSRIHEYIDRADNKHIEAMYLLLEKEIATSNQYDEETLKLLYQRLDNDIKNTGKSYSAEETFEYARATHNSKK